MVLKSKNAYKCHRCPEIDCINLFYHNRQHENVGGELYIYELLGKKMKENDELNKYVCRNGNLLKVMCFLVDPITELEEKSFLKDVLDQSVKDLKASMFLAFSGHYRQAMQVLRCSFENLISGAYFHSDLIKLQGNCDAKEELIKLESRFNEWKENGHVNIRASLEILRRTSFLNYNEEKEWNELYNNLSRFIHTPKEYVFSIKHKDMLKDIEMTCLSTTYFSEDALKAWSDSFEKVFTAILKIIVQYHPFAIKTETGKMAVNELRSIEQEYRIKERTLNQLYDKLVLPTLNLKTN
jgi:hypothetical protein